MDDCAVYYTLRGADFQILMLTQEHKGRVIFMKDGRNLQVVQYFLIFR